MISRRSYALLLLKESTAVYTRVTTFSVVINNCFALVRSIFSLVLFDGSQLRCSASYYSFSYFCPLVLRTSAKHVRTSSFFSRYSFISRRSYALLLLKESTAVYTRVTTFSVVINNCFALVRSIFSLVLFDGSQLRCSASYYSFSYFCPLVLRTSAKHVRTSSFFSRFSLISRRSYALLLLKESTAVYTRVTTFSVVINNCFALVRSIFSLVLFDASQLRCCAFCVIVTSSTSTVLLLRFSALLRYRYLRFVHGFL